VFSVWFAPVKSEARGQSLMLPVLATGELGGWKFAAYTARAKIDGQPISSPVSIVKSSTFTLQVGRKMKRVCILLT